MEATVMTRPSSQPVEALEPPSPQITQEADAGRVAPFQRIFADQAAPGQEKAGVRSSARSPGFAIGMIALDVVLAFLSLVAGYFAVVLILNRHSNIPPAPLLAGWMVPSVVAAALVGGWRRRAEFMGLRYMAEFIIAQGFAVLLGGGLTAFSFNYGWSINPSRAWYLASVASFGVLSFLFRRFIGAHALRTFGQEVLLIGSEAEASRLAVAMLGAGFTSKVHLIEPEGPAGLENLDEEIRSRFAQFAGRVESVVLGPSVEKYGSLALSQLVRLHLVELPVLTWDAFYGERFRQIPLDTLSPTWIFNSEFRLAERSVYSLMKRVLDVIFSFTLLVIFAPVLLAALLGIRLADRGPLFFRQERVGYHGRKFVVWKLRTMRVDPAPSGTTTTGDPRIFPLGRLLRKYRIDEIPQLWNILHGEMSLIGPRPEWTACVEEYEQAIPLYHLRHAVKPGLTGWAQVNYPYGENIADAREKFAFDLYYIRHFSLTLDCAIIIKTVYVMLGGQGGR